MNKYKKVIFVVSISFPLLFIIKPTISQAKEYSSLFISHEVIEKNQLKAETNNDTIQLAIQQLIRKAKRELTLGPYSVVYSKVNPLNVDPHNYSSVSTYWWPDPEKPEGLPYIRKDGVVNPERDFYDKKQSVDFHKGIETLTLAYLYSDDSIYAQRAFYLIRVWFIEDSTRMNPNMKYAQFVPGRSEGRSFGIIESRNFLYVLDYASILHQKGELSTETYQDLMHWAETFLDWLLTSDHGKKEKEAINNHGTWFDVQAMGFAILTNRKDVINEIAGSFYKRRVKNHILRDGQQPEELKRTKAFFYSTFNLLAITQFYQLALHANALPDKNRDSILKSIHQAIDFLYPYALNPEKWPYEQIQGFEGGQACLAEVLLVLGNLYPQENYIHRAKKIPLPLEIRNDLIIKYGIF
ncbi:MAG: alginate lyase family protein [Candidatus Marinimicrobia bacterium]|nr:alginate lyase family protein [Candidatus Neomarinimicrobiota bacterium]